MAAKFTLYIKQKGGSKESAEKAITLLKTYLPKVVEKNATFDSSDAVLVADDASPTILDTDVIVYLVSRVAKSVIGKKGGSTALAESNGNLLGMTDLNLKICEVYFDRLYEGSPKELSGAVFHEAAHIKSNKDNSMHSGQNGFLKESPDYNGSPTDENNAFLAKHLGTKVTMNTSY
ncbi:MAG: hypothetical protein ACRD6X_08350 [Pyrinomonadaceae bacterium]